MKNQENEKDASIFAKYSEEFIDDGIKYHMLSDLDEFNTLLMCESKSGIIIKAPKGCGKTSFMRQFVQQNLSKELGVDSVKVIYVFEDFISESKNKEETLKNLASLCKMYANNAVILFSKISDTNALVTYTKLFSRYSKQIKEECGNTLLKFVIECTVEDGRESNEKYHALDIKNFSTFNLTVPYNLSDRIKIYNAMAQNLSNIYNININAKNLFLMIAVVLGCVNNNTNLDEFYGYMEYVFSYAKREKQKQISKKVIKNALKDVFEKLSKYDKSIIKSTAYHESGHAMFSLMNSQFSHLELVTIIPGKSYMGITRSSKSDEFVNVVKDKQFVLNQIAETIAGRQAERLIIYPYTPDKGARSDLYYTRDMVDELISEYGISKSLGSNYVIKKEEPISENMRQHIEREKAQIIEEASQIAFQEVFKHREFIEKLAQKLIDNLVVSGDEARKMWKEHLKELEKEEKSNN